MTTQFQHPLGREYYASIKAASENKKSEENGFFYKALGADSTTSGGEFIPEGFSAEIIWQIRENNWARQLFGTYILTQGYKENIPKFSTKIREASKVSSPVDALPSELTSTTSIEKADFTSTEVELTLKTLAISLQIQNKFIEYNVNPQIETMLREEIAGAMAEEEENMIINGDNETTAASNINYTYNSSTNKNGVNTATGDNEHLLLFDGLRISAAGTAVDAATAAWTATNFRTAIKNMGKYARKGKDKLAFIVSPDLYSAMLGFSNIETMEKYGPQATVVTGEVFKIYGIRVICTDKMPCTEAGTLTDSTGVRGASGNNYTEFILVYIDTVILGVPNKRNRTFNIKKKEWPEYDRVELIAIEDFGFAIKHTAAIVRGYGGTA